MCLRDQIFRVLLEHFISEVVHKIHLAGSNVIGSFSEFCYKFCEKVTTAANVWRFLVYYKIDFVQMLSRKQLLYLF